MVDRRGRLESDPFAFTVTRDQLVRISRAGKHVTTLGANASARFLAAVEDTEEPARQQLMARATGNYKRGNERRGRP
ncbi:MAG: hypothetical protein O3A10_06320 [Chloroflexi bacterium]|nr:hypothetical protein [Chloroflexota bacterium]MDA1145597.1 hypothetical protein [Chloroflexota bacterium]